MQDEYGRVSQRFAGVNLLFSDPRALDDFVSVLRAGSGRSARSLIDWRASLPDERQYEFTLTSTVLDHEARHFHDYLVTPFGAFACLLRTLATYQGMHVVARLPTLSAIHQVPVGRWISKNARSLRPEVFPSGLAPLAKQAVKMYARLEELMLSHTLVSPSGVVRPRTVFEASAFLVQLQAVYHCYDEVSAQDMLNRFLSTSYLTQYVWPFRAFWPDEPQSCTRCLATVLHWSLCGDPFSHSQKGDPAVRIAWLIDYYRAHPAPPPSTPASELLESWARAFGERPIVDTQTDVLERVRAKITTLISKAMSAPVSELLLHTEAILQATEAMHRAYATDPERYIWSDRYLEAAAEWVAAPIRIQVSPGGLEDPPGLAGFECEVGRAHGSTRIGHVFRSLYQTPGTRILDARACSQTANLHAMCDLYFSETDRYNDSELEYMRWERTDAGIELWELLGQWPTSTD